MYILGLLHPTKNIKQAVGLLDSHNSHVGTCVTVPIPYSNYAQKFFVSELDIKKLYLLLITVCLTYPLLQPYYP